MTLYWLSYTVTLNPSLLNPVSVLMNRPSRAKLICTSQDLNRRMARGRVRKKKKENRQRSPVSVSIQASPTSLGAAFHTSEAGELRSPILLTECG